MMQIKVAIIGAGFMASEHIKAFSAIEDVALVGIYSRTRTRADALAQQFNIAGVFNAVDELYAATQADLVIVAVPELHVRNVCLQVFKYPWVALIEKPAGYDLADAKKIAAAAQQNARRAYVALNRRHYSSTRAFDISVDIGVGRMVGERNSDECRQMQHRVATFHCFFHAMRIADVARKDLELSLYVPCTVVQPAPGVE